MRIAQTLKNDKRANTRINAVVHNTRIYLSIDNIHINLSNVEAMRIFNVLDKALNIQDSVRLQKKEKKPELF